MLTRRSFAKLAAASLTRVTSGATHRPNIVLILVDDLGWTDLGCFGSEFYQTPNIDRLASDGMKFTQAYSACTVCSPSRAAVLTGKYPARLHVTDWIPGHPYPFAKLKPPDWTMRLPHEETSIAESLKKAGYSTASIGKWHLGGREFYPETHGFDINIAGTDKGSPASYFSPYRIPTLPDGPGGEYLTDRECTEALKFIANNREKPFFLYLPHHAVHNPVQSKPEVVQKYTQRVRDGAMHNKPGYAALVESVDDSVGRITAKLKELNLHENTVVILTGDNGGLLQNTSNAPLRAGKGSAYEGGVRVPTIVRWTGSVQPGVTCATPIMGIDFASTIHAITGIPRGAASLDGESILPLLRGSDRLQRDTLYWHYPHYHPGGATPYSAIRQRDLKLIEFHEDGRAELYDLAKDIGETNDLAQKIPGKVRELTDELHRWRKNVGAQMAVPNPGYDPARWNHRPDPAGRPY